MICPRCGSENRPYSTKCWMCRFQFVDGPTIARVQSEGKEYIRSIPLRRRLVDETFLGLPIWIELLILAAILLGLAGFL